MRNLLTAFIVLVCLSYNGIAQNNSATISGKIIDNNNNGVGGATVILLSAKDSSLIKSDITKTNGEYEMAGIRSGNFIISATAVGLKKSVSKSFSLKENETYILAPIALQNRTVELDNINVESKKPLIVVTSEKTILNIEGSINATGSNAFELLQKSPGITVDKDDNFSLRGKNGVRIYIDGKQSQLGGKDLADFLRSVNSADLESIEIITNPGAKYEAAGNAGIINFKLKKNQAFGTNGSVTAGVGYGFTEKINSSITLNHRNKVINIFGNYSNNFGERRASQSLYRIQNDTIYDQHVINYTDPHIHNFKTGMDFFINPKNTLGFIVNGNFNNVTYANRDGITFIMKNGTTAPQKILYSSGTQYVERSNLNYNVNYRYNFKGTELLIDGDLGRFGSKANSDQLNKYKTPSGVLIEEKNFSNNTPVNIDINTVKIDFETPLMKGKFGIGGKYSDVKTKNIFDFYNVVNGNATLDINRSNKFNFVENINAAYVNFNSPLGKTWSIRAGVRMENTISEGNLISNTPQPDNNVKRNYVDFFPSGGLSHTPNDKNAFNLSYSKRIDRPNYIDLNPFEDKIDELTYQKGNAFLRPQYTDIFELSHTYNNKFTTALSYSHVTDYSTSIIDTTDKNRIFRTVKNLASHDIYNINISAPFSITKWWNVFLNANAFHSKYKADFGTGKTIDLSINAYTLYGQQTFTIKPGFTFELSGFYNSPNIFSGTFKNKALGTLDAGIQKSLFKKRGNLKVSYTDIFETVRYSAISDYGGAYLHLKLRGESTQLKVNFTYRFGSATVKAARQRKMGLDDENNRIGN